MSHTVPERVSSVTARRSSHFSMTVGWAESGNGESEILSYEIRYTPTGNLARDTTSAYVVVNGDITSQHISGIASNLAYDVQVRARSVEGYGPYSSKRSVSGV